MIRRIRSMSIPRASGRSEAADRVSATEAAKNFGRLVDRVREEQAVYVIERGGAPVAQIGPVAAASFTVGQLKALVEALSPVDSDYVRAVGRAVARHNRPRVRRNPWER
jgi:antitoxin (DNA-binding transcriptional repressor) of toxin-antitoxin stability system